MLIKDILNEKTIQKVYEVSKDTKNKPDKKKAPRR